MKPGDRLFYVPGQLPTYAHHVTVEKVGSKWAYLDNGARVNITTRLTDESPLPGRVYFSEAEYSNELRTHKAWVEFRRAVARRYVMPDGVSLEDINRAKELLGL